jgi:cytochrome c oxidase assembly protein subunit 15
MTVSPARFRVVALAALVAMVLIVVTGAAVRLTGSGLGCSSWPGCEPGHFVAPLGYHHWVEFGNRIVSGFVVAVSLLALVAALLRTPRRRDLTWLSAGLVAGVFAQVVLGALTVHFDLRPPWVMAHFLLSMLLVLDAAVLQWRSCEAVGRRALVVRREAQWLTAAIVALGAAVLVLGTVVTGTGPHAGDKETARFGFDLRTVAQAHADAVMLLIGLTLALGLLLVATGAWQRTRAHYVFLVAVMLAQAVVGFTQYALHLPAGLVEVHVLGATLFWLAAVRMLLALREPVDVPLQLAAASTPTSGMSTHPVS